MRAPIHILSSAFLLVLLYAALPAAKAAASADLSVSGGGKNFQIDSDTITEWKRSFKLYAPVVIRPKSLLHRPLAQVRLDNKRPVSEYKIYSYDPNQIYRYIKNLAEDVNTPVAEPKLKIEHGKVTEFSPPREGLAVDIYTTTKNILEALEHAQASTTLAVSVTLPRESLAETNTFGINERVAFGESNFKGSPKNRRHNITTGVSKVTGILIAPQAEFSFNKYLGPVEAEEGFLPELVIKRTGTVPELGGGLCQVSSTVFRAAMNAGLPITQRRNHSYAVQYYAPQGTDATIYPGVIDLKFINDTPGYLLLWAYFKDNNTLVYELYGTKDSREVVLKKPVTYDRKPDGSMKATWERVVTKNGEERRDVFNSVYLSPALFHKEEEFVTAAPPEEAATSTPETTL